MKEQKFEELGKGVVKRTQKRVVGIFVDGVGLDRATKRISRKIDLTNLITTLATGLTVECARYYTLLPNRDDSRQSAFLDLVERSGFVVTIKRLPPVEVNRMVSTDVHFATDLVGYTFGQFSQKTDDTEEKVQRVAVFVCPNPEVGYAIERAHACGIETRLADFGGFKRSDIWKGIDTWVDLSESESIWRE
jgi:hypothetical protein